MKKCYEGEGRTLESESSNGDENKFFKFQVFKFIKFSKKLYTYNEHRLQIAS